MRTAAAILSMLLLLGCSDSDSPAASEPALGDGESFKQELVQLIEQSDRIVITEHSYPFDLFDTTANKSLVPTEIVYGRRVLDAKQHQRLAAEIRLLDATSQSAFSACIFEPHHRITFISKHEPLAAMEVCFGCSQIEWASNNRIPPEDIYEKLALFITSVGLQPEQDWRARAVTALRKPE